MCSWPDLDFRVEIDVIQQARAKKIKGLAKPVIVSWRIFNGGEKNSLHKLIIIKSGEKGLSYWWRMHNRAEK